MRPGRGHRRPQNHNLDQRSRPQIRKLADEPLQFRLAISLHGATDEIRNKIMPVNRKYPLAELIAACEYYQQSRDG